MTNIPSNPKPQFQEKSQSAVRPPKVNKAEVKKQLFKIIKANRKIEEEIKTLSP